MVTTMTTTTKRRVLGVVAYAEFAPADQGECECVRCATTECAWNAGMLARSVAMCVTTFHLGGEAMA